MEEIAATDLVDLWEIRNDMAVCWVVAPSSFVFLIALLKQQEKSRSLFAQLKFLTAFGFIL